MPRPTAPSVAAADLDARCLELRRHGATYRQIGQQLGISPTNAHKRVARGLDLTRREPADALRALELERLDALQLELTEVLARQHHTISGGKVVVDQHGRPYRDDGPTVSAAQALVRVQESRRRLLGLDAPTKHELRGQLSIDAIDARIAELEAELDAADRAEGRDPYQRRKQELDKRAVELAQSLGWDVDERARVHEDMLRFWQRWKDDGRALRDPEGFVADALSTAVGIMALPHEQAEMLASRIERFLLERAP